MRGRVWRVEIAYAERIIANYFREKPGVAAVYLFGSVAKGRPGRGSDVDIGVLWQIAPAAIV